MYKKFLLLIFPIGILFNSTILLAERPSPKAGDIASFYSANKQFQIDIVLQPMVIDSPSEAVFKKENNVIWRKELPATPGFVNISDDGEHIVMANWGWYDEGGFKSLSFFDGKGNLLQELKFQSPESRNMRWIQKPVMSQNGNYYAIGNNSKKKSEITLYDVTAQKELWTKEVGLESLGDIAISKDGASILVSTYNWNCILFVCNSPKDAEFVYLDKSGNILWSQKFENGYGWNQNFIELNEDGRSFKIYDLKQKEWASFKNQNGTIKAV